MYSVEVIVDVMRGRVKHTHTTAHARHTHTLIHYKHARYNYTTKDIHSYKLKCAMTSATSVSRVCLQYPTDL